VERSQGERENRTRSGRIDWAATLFMTTVCACPVAFVSVATRLPVATNCGVPEGLFCTAKLLMLNVPVIVPLPSELSELSWER
jgi:hypothetical protein